MSVMGKIIPQISSRNFGKFSAALYSGKYNRNYFTYTQELSQPLDRKPEYVTAKEAFEKCLKSGKWDFIFQTYLYAIMLYLKEESIYAIIDYYIVSREDFIGQSV